ncbi:MAG: prepilin-type N-terminal cleavage/methylation domain-containing protein [Pseudomonadota bacterium]
MNKNISFKKSQSGFTLVEIAIVLVIIGLLLGGVLKGTELIDNAKVKRAVGEINGVTAAFYAYQDRYQRLPGDDGPNVAALRTRGGSWSNVGSSGNNNGIFLVTLAQTFTGGGEGAAFWQHLKAAGFISGNPADLVLDALPRNAFGGLLGVTSVAVGDPAAPISGRIVCSSQVPGKSAAAMDVAMDDGNANTGKLRASAAGLAGVNTAPTAAAVAPAYNEGSYYTICSQI